MLEEPTDQTPDSTNTAEQTAMTPDHEPRPWLLQKKPSAPHGKRRIIGIITAAVAVVIAILGWAVYALWYQNPDKVVLDAIINAASAKSVAATGSISGGAANYSATFNVKGGYGQGLNGAADVSYKSKDGAETKFDVAGAHSANGDDFLKINNLKTIADVFLKPPAGESASSKAAQVFYQSLIQPVVAKVDGKWVNLTPDDVKKIDANKGQDYDCIEKSILNLGTDPSKLIELGTIYWNNKFVVVKQNLGEKSGNFGYVIGLDKTKAQQFVDALGTSKFYTDLKNCSDSINLELDYSQLDKDAISRTEVWIDQWSHQLRSIHVEAKDKTVFDAQTTFNQPVTVSTPTNAVVLNDVFSGLEQTFVSSYNALFKSD